MSSKQVDMKPSEAAKIARQTFLEVQGTQDISGVLVEAIHAPTAGSKEWQVTIGHSPQRDLLGIPVQGGRLRSTVRLAEDGTFLGMDREREQ